MLSTLTIFSMDQGKLTTGSRSIGWSDVRVLGVLHHSFAGRKVTRQLSLLRHVALLPTVSQLVSWGLSRTGRVAG